MNDSPRDRARNEILALIIDNVKRCATKRTTAYVNRTAFRTNRRATKRAMQHINKDEFRMNRRAAKRATQHID
jgi:hypothetical protein